MIDYKNFQTVTDLQEQIEREERTSRTVGWVLIGGAAMVALTGFLMFQCTEAVIKTAENQERYYSQQAVQLSAEQEEYRSFFVRHGSPQPEAMALAVTATRRPALMAAIAVAESNGDPAAVGDGGESLGAFQVQEKHWGEVSASPVQQALQAERILEGLLKERERLRCQSDRIRASLAAYNGGQRPSRVSYKYADRVMKLVEARLLVDVSGMPDDAAIMYVTDAVRGMARGLSA